MRRYKFEACDIYNMDETGVTTVQTPESVVGRKRKKQIGAITSHERGVLVTCVVLINATGNSIPPFFIFPRKKFQDYFVRDGPTGCHGTTNGSGWMQEEDFLLYVKHFTKHVRPSLDHAILLTLDNHGSHLSIQVFDFCEANGITLLSFPPHTLHKLQPLERGVFGPSKKAINSVCGSWMMRKPG